MKKLYYELLNNINIPESMEYYDNVKDTISIKKEVSDVFREIQWLDNLEKEINVIDKIILVQQKEYEKSKTITYDNKFLVSTIIDAKECIQNYLKKSDFEEVSKISKETIYKSKSKVKNEDVIVKINVINEKIKNKEDIKINNSIKLRVEMLLNTINNYYNHEFIQSIKDKAVLKGKVNLSKIISEDKNTKKLIKVWEIITNDVIIKLSKVKSVNTDEKTINVDEYMKISSFISYKSAKQAQKIESKESEFYLKELIKVCVNDIDLSQKDLKNLIVKEYKLAKKTKLNTQENIKEELDIIISNHYKKIDEAVDYINMGGEL